MIDQSMYPDVPAPTSFASDAERADYVARVCAAWDFGIPPEHPALSLFASWREVFDEYPLPQSIAYHAFRSWYGWPRMEGRVREADYERFDRRDGRVDDIVI